MNKKTGKKSGVTITWYGHSAFSLQAPSGKIVLIDPWVENPKSPAGAKERINADLILITHGHADHIGNTVEIAQRTGAKVIAIHEVALYLQSAGVASATGMNKGGTVEHDGVRVLMVDARHSGDIDVGGTIAAPGGEAAGFVVWLENGYCVYHAGDTALFGDMRFIGKLYEPDAALLPIGDLYTMGPREAAVACDLIKPRTIIGMHYGTFPPLVGTPQQLRRHLHTKMKNRVLEIVPGNPTVIFR